MISRVSPAVGIDLQNCNYMMNSGLQKSDVPRASSVHKLLHFSHLIQIKDGFGKTIMGPS